MKKRLFFYSNIYRKDASVGITKKVSSQIEVMKKRGYEVVYTSYTKHGIEILENDVVLYEHSSRMPLKIYRFYRRYFLLYHIAKYLNESTYFDIGYLRYNFFDRLFLKMLKNLKQEKTTIILEAHGWPMKEKPNAVTFIPYTLDTIYTRSCRKYIDYVAAISSEKNILDCKTIQMDNGIDCTNIALQNKIIDDAWDIRFISVSNEYEYHGYAKLIRSLAEYKRQGGNQRIQLIFVGQFLEGTRKLTEELNLEECVYFAGKRYGSELEKLYNHADLGIGALSSRCGVVHGSSIKTKEYFAKGIPFVTAWREYSIKEGYPYVLYLDPFSENIDMNEIISFYNRICKDKDMPYKMRKFAEDNYTWDKQLGSVIDTVELNEVTNYK